MILGRILVSWYARVLCWNQPCSDVCTCATWSYTGVLVCSCPILITSRAKLCAVCRLIFLCDNQPCKCCVHCMLCVWVRRARVLYWSPTEQVLCAVCRLIFLFAVLWYLAVYWCPGVLVSYIDNQQGKCCVKCATWSFCVLFNDTWPYPSVLESYIDNQPGKCCVLCVRVHRACFLYWNQPYSAVCSVPLDLILVSWWARVLYW